MMISRASLIVFSLSLFGATSALAAGPYFYKCALEVRPTAERERKFAIGYGRTYRDAVADAREACEARYPAEDCAAGAPKDSDLRCLAGVYYAW